MNTNASEFDRTVTLREAYQLLEAFIVQYHTRGERSTVELLADIGLGPQGYSSDPAQLQDFLNTADTLFGPDNKQP
jgi:hypothetical protein